MQAIISIRLHIVEDIINASTANGASFCHVDKYRAVIHGNAVMADGYQK